MPRKVPFSGKAKKEQLKQKKIKSSFTQQGKLFKVQFSTTRPCIDSLVFISDVIMLHMYVFILRKYEV